MLFANTNIFFLHNQICSFGSQIPHFLLATHFSAYFSEISVVWVNYFFINLSFLVGINFQMATITTTRITNEWYFCNMALNGSYSLFTQNSSFFVIVLSRVICEKKRKKGKHLILHDFWWLMVGSQVFIVFQHLTNTSLRPHGFVECSWGVCEVLVFDSVLIHRCLIPKIVRC